MEKDNMQNASDIGYFVSGLSRSLYELVISVANREKPEMET